MCSGELADVLAGGEPGRLQVGDVVEEQPGHRDQPQVLQRGRLGAALEVVVLRLVGPRDEGPEAAGTVLHVADHPQVLDALGVGLAGAHHHRGGGLDAEAVRDLHHLEPALAGLLERRDRLARPVRQHLRAGAGDRVQPGRLDPADRLLDGDAGDLGHVQDLARPDRVDDQLRVGRLDRGEQLLVVLDAVVRVVAALQHHLGRAEVDRLAAAAQDLLRSGATSPRRASAPGRRRRTCTPSRRRWCS